MRTKFPPLIFFALIFASLTPNLATSCIFSSEAGVRLESYEYREIRDNNVLIDKESGLLPGLQLGLNANCDQWQFSTGAATQQARLEYDGQTNSGRKLASRTQENVSEVSAQVGRRFGISDTNSIGLYGGAGYWQWQRNIASVGIVSGLDEKYRWRFYYLGGNLSLLEKNPHRLMLDMRWLRMTQARLSVDFRGLFDKPDDLELRIQNGWRVALPWQYSLNPTNAIHLEPYVQGWRIPSSAAKPLAKNGIIVGDFFEPASTTRLYGITLNWQHYY
jgi:hypothetical protein